MPGISLSLGQFVYVFEEGEEAEGQQDIELIFPEQRSMTFPRKH